MDEKLKKLSEKKRQLDQLRPLPPEQVKNIQDRGISQKIC